MAKPKCPKCHRSTWNEKYKQCSAGGCVLNSATNPRQPLSERRVSSDGPLRLIAPPPQPVREPIERIPDPVLVEGEPCPACGKPVGKRKNTERVKKWREGRSSE